MLTLAAKIAKRASQVLGKEKKDPTRVLLKEPQQCNVVPNATYANEVIVRFNGNATRTDGGDVDKSHWKGLRDDIVCITLTKKVPNGIQESAVLDEEKLLNGQPGKQLVAGTYSHVEVNDPSTYEKHPNSAEIVEKHQKLIEQVFDASLANTNKKKTQVVNKHTYQGVISKKKPKNYLEKDPKNANTPTDT